MFVLPTSMVHPGTPLSSESCTPLLLGFTPRIVHTNKGGLPPEIENTNSIHYYFCT